MARVATGMHGSVFISYSNKDRQIAERICLGLEQRGLSCWIASRNLGPGENFAESISRAIAAARVMVVVFSAHANKSAEIQKEITLADSNGLVVIPARIADLEPTGGYSYQLASRQRVDLFSDWEASLGRLASGVASVTGARRVAPLRPTPDKVSPPIVSTSKGPRPVAAARPRHHRLSLAMLGSAALVGAVGVVWLVYSTGDTPIAAPKSFAQHDASKPARPSGCGPYEAWCR